MLYCSGVIMVSAKKSLPMVGTLVLFGVLISCRGLGLHTIMAAATLPGQWSLITISQYNHSFHPMFLMEHAVVIVSPLRRSVGCCRHVPDRLTADTVGANCHGCIHVLPLSVFCSSYPARGTTGVAGYTCQLRLLQKPYRTILWII